MFTAVSTPSNIATNCETGNLSATCIWLRSYCPNDDIQAAIQENIAVEKEARNVRDWDWFVQHQYSEICETLGSGNT